MNDNINKILIKEDVEFLGEYLGELLMKHPELLILEKDLFKKIQRRLQDIDNRVEA